MLLIVLFIAFLILLIHNLWTRPKVPGLVQACIDFPFIRGMFNGDLAFEKLFIFGYYFCFDIHIWLKYCIQTLSFVI